MKGISALTKRRPPENSLPLQGDKMAPGSQGKFLTRQSDLPWPWTPGPSNSENKHLLFISCPGRCDCNSSLSVASKLAEADLKRKVWEGQTSMYTVLLLTEEHLQKCVYFFAASCSMRDLSFPARDQTRIPCSGSAESQPLHHQGSPCTSVFKPERHLPSQEAVGHHQ